MSNVVREHLDESYRTGGSIAAEIFLRLPATLLLAATALALAVVAGIPFSLMTAVKRGTWLPLRTPLEVLLSFGRGNVASGQESPLEETDAAAGIIGEEKVPSAVVDTEPGFLRLGMVQPVAEAMGAQHLKLEDLPADNLAEVVRMQIPVGGEPPPNIG